jgi:hypothetical protein
VTGADNDDAVIVTADRQDRAWVTHAADHGVIVQGRTLSGLQTNVEAAMAFKHATAPAPPVRVQPCSPELHALAQVRLRYQEALRKAMQALREDGVSWSDAARACQVRVADAQAVLGLTISGASTQTETDPEPDTEIPGSAPSVAARPGTAQQARDSG